MALGGPRVPAEADVGEEADRTRVDEEEDDEDEDEEDDAADGSAAEGDEASAGADAKADGCISVSSASEAGGSGGSVSGVKMLRC